MLGATMVVPTIPVSDLERSKGFYGETLGLTVLWEPRVHSSRPATSHRSAPRWGPGFATPMGIRWGSDRDSSERRASWHS